MACLLIGRAILETSSSLRPMPNPRFEGTAGKRSLPVPRPLRGRAAPQAERYASRHAS
ncbi:MAG: hypothetical protein H6R05_82 [Burkholderiaceae bacterium]|nr:hypothetical protein [Burkholderiaceae bacterium]